MPSELAANNQFSGNLKSIQDGLMLRSFSALYADSTFVDIGCEDEG